MQRNRLFTSMPLGNNAGTEIRTRLRLRSTVRGANNRLDIDAIVSYDRGGGAPIPMLGQLRHYRSSLCLSFLSNPAPSGFSLCARAVLIAL